MLKEQAAKSYLLYDKRVAKGKGKMVFKTTTAQTLHKTP